MGDNSKGKPANPESQFHCSAEWHFVQMKSRLAAPIYGWASKVSRRSGVFHASAEHMAQYFGVNRKTIFSALDELTAGGFLELMRKERFKPNIYKVIGHKEWAIAHPGRCVRQVEYPWKGEGDPLGRQLYAISGGRVKFWPNQMTGLRNIGFSDEEITEHFRAFIERKAGYVGSQWERAYYDFYGYLKRLYVSPAAVASAHILNGIESYRADSGTPRRVRSNGLGRVQSNGPNSSTVSFDGKGDATIPAGAELSRHPTRNLKAKPSQDKENTTPLPITIRERIQKGLTQQELEERRRFLLKQSEEIRARYPQAPIRSGQAH
jgi:hypothetical protein